MVVRLIFILTVATYLLSSAYAEETARPGKLTGGKETIHPEWFKESFLDIAEDVDEAAQENKHLLLFMHLNNCPYCSKMAAENFTHAPYVEFIKKNFDVIAINIKGDRQVAFDEKTTVTEKQLAKLLKVRYTPTILALNQDNKTVLRLNGYRSRDAFEQALHFVNDKAYLKTNLSQYIKDHYPDKRYRFRDHPQFVKLQDLSKSGVRPLAVLFEDTTCDACNALHDGHLRNPAIGAVLQNFTVVRLDANSEDPILDPKGNKTTPRRLAEELNLSYRPGIVLFDQGKEISRIDGLLYTYHFTEMLRYVGERHYKAYPNSFYDYLNIRTDNLLKSGISIDLSK